MNEEDSGLSILQCTDCTGIMVVKYVDVKINQDKIDVYVNDCPFLVCSQCDQEKMDTRAKATINDRVEKAKDSGEKEIVIQGPPSDLRYNYCEKYSLDYDGRDYQAIPGLHRRWNDGKLTPVFFNRSVLAKYFTQPDYFMSLHSASYGGIGHIDSWSISYGINQRNEVVMWLGDIAELPENEIYYLKSENIPSSHDIFSGFYKAQIEVQYPELSEESKLLENRNTFFRTVFENLKFNLSHLNDEIIDIAEMIVRPPVWTNGILKNIIDSLNKLCVESFNSAKIKSSLKSLHDISGKDVKSLGSLKLLGLWVEKFLNPFDIRELMLPLYVLYDYRVFLLHLQSNKTRKELLDSILVRLSLDPKKSSDEIIYSTLVLRLNVMWEELITLAEKTK